MDWKDRHHIAPTRSKMDKLNLNCSSAAAATARRVVGNGGSPAKVMLRPLIGRVQDASKDSMARFPIHISIRSNEAEPRKVALMRDKDKRRTTEDA